MRKNCKSKHSSFFNRMLLGAAVTFIMIQPVVHAEDVSNSHAGLTEREMMLLERIASLEQRLKEVESKVATSHVSPALFTSRISDTIQEEPSSINSESPASAISSETSQPGGVLDIFRNTTFNVTLDGYYEYNFNSPATRLNLLRAYDVLSNSFSLNQAAVVIDNSPEAGKTNVFGLRLDLQYGQATETVQGSSVNELRPQAYRPIWQAYGTYIAPVGNGLRIDFGKFASSLGYETNYTKDNWNYSRSYYFNFLPYYHLGFRLKYPVNDRITLMYHLMNGAQQSEDFNGFKSQHFAFILAPKSNVSWQMNYYIGREQKDVVPIYNPTTPTVPTQPGLPTEVIQPLPRGLYDALDTYVTWYVTDQLTLAGDADYVTNRVEENSPQAVVTGGAFYASYAFTPFFELSGRAEYLSDKDELFSGVSQILKEITLTGNFTLTSGFNMYAEWRRDSSTQPFFFSENPNVFKTSQNTLGTGLVWWIGGKEGAW